LYIFIKNNAWPVKEKYYEKIINQALTIKDWTSHPTFKLFLLYYDMLSVVNAYFFWPKETSQ
jgi:hypothetical protein